MARVLFVHESKNNHNRNFSLPGTHFIFTENLEDYNY